MKTSNRVAAQSTDLTGLVEIVSRRAQRQGFIEPREVREELKQAGLPGTRWKDVITLARPSLRLRQGRYYYAAPVSERMRREQATQQAVRKAIRDVIRQHKAAASVERRGEGRFEFVQPVQVETEDGKTYTLLSRDISATGIRLVGTRRLLGQKVIVRLPRPDSAEPWSFVVRILWTCAIGDDLVENGGSLVEVR